jgi:hypothetical protein
MKIKPSLVLITGMSLASTSFLQAGITNLKANGNFEVTNSNTNTPILLAIGGDTGTTKIGKYSILASYLSATDDCYFNGLRIGKGSGNVTNSTAIGFAVLNGDPAAGYTNTGNLVTGVGSYALQYNSSGSLNTAIGHAALQLNTTGNNNTACGVGVLRTNTTGSDNAASGVNSMVTNTSGNRNSAVGMDSLRNNIQGNENTAIGTASLLNNAASQNTGVGTAAFHNNTVGYSNTAIGHHAGAWMNNGATPLTTSYNSIYIGASSRGMSNADNNSIVIGAWALGEGANTTVIGNGATVSTHLYGKTTTDSLQVNGNTVLSGTVVLAQPQGDISMGAYQ